MNYNISTFNPKQFTKSLLHQELEDNSISPLVGFLYNVWNTNDKDFRIKTTDFLNQYKKYAEENNICSKYEISQTKFNVELTTLYNIKKITSNGMYFEINLNLIKNMLQEKYKYKFDNNNNDKKKKKKI